MKIQFDSKLRLSPLNKIKLGSINEILEEYMLDGYTLTLRQLYYQLVSKGVIPNSQKEYTKLMHILKKGRMAGVIDWNAIEDRIRRPERPYWVTGIPHAIRDTITQYRLDRMEGQDQTIEVWIEKDALSSIFSRITKKYHINLMVNRGYSSVSAMYKASGRLSSGDTILYFGDHDPSGLDMVRDIEERLTSFGKAVNVVPVALNLAQVKQFGPPPNPAKIKDPRSAWYIERYGYVSWELDALPPKELARLTEEAIRGRIDLNQFDFMVEQEKKDIKELKTKFGL